ncbi:MAG: hypothetical protein WA539_06420, partial [Candidatus Sulfotelmatobacter sp.]
KAVCVPRHIELSEPGRRLTGGLVKVFAQLKLRVWKLRTSGTGSKNWDYFTVKLRNARYYRNRYYFGVHGKCNFFVAKSIVVDFLDGRR